MCLRSLFLYMLLVLAHSICLYSQSSPEELLSAKDYFLLGAAKYKCNACERSIDDFDQAIKLESDYGDAYYGRSLAYLCLRKYNKAMIDIKQATRCNPEEVLFRELQGRIRSFYGDRRGAIDDFKKALDMDSLCWQAWYGLAKENYTLVKLDESLDSYNEAIRLNPDFTLAIIGKGRLLIDLGNYPAALALLARARELEPYYAIPYAYSSLAYLKLGDYLEAVEMADSALKYNSELKMLYFYLGEAYFAQEQYIEADFNYAKALKKNKKNSQAWYKRGKTQELMGILKSAKKFYSKAIQKDPTDADFYISRAELLMKMEKTKAAHSDYSKAILLDKENVGLYIQRGFLRIQLEYTARAIQDFQFAINKNPFIGEAWLGFGDATYQNDQFRVACNHWKRAVDLGSNEAGYKLKKFCND